LAVCRKDVDETKICREEKLQRLYAILPFLKVHRNSLNLKKKKMRKLNKRKREILTAILLGKSQIYKYNEKEYYLEIIGEVKEEDRMVYLKNVLLPE
jgi:hypothetical protein